jgi:hypothetical protein
MVYGSGSSASNVLVQLITTNEFGGSYSADTSASPNVLLPTWGDLWLPAAPMDGGGFAFLAVFAGQGVSINGVHWRQWPSGTSP